MSSPRLSNSSKKYELKDLGEDSGEDPGDDSIKDLGEDSGDDLGIEVNENPVLYQKEKEEKPKLLPFIIRDNNNFTEIIPHQENIDDNLDSELTKKKNLLSNKEEVKANAKLLQKQLHSHDNKVAEPIKPINEVVVVSKEITETDKNIIYISINIPIINIVNVPPSQLAYNNFLNKNIFYNIGKFFNDKEQVVKGDSSTEIIIQKIFSFQLSCFNGEVSVDYSFWFNDIELYKIDTQNMQTFLNGLETLIKKSNTMVTDSDIVYQIKGGDDSIVGGSNDNRYIKIKLPFEKVENKQSIETLSKPYTNEIQTLITTIIKQKVVKKFNNSNDLLQYIIMNTVHTGEYYKGTNLPTTNAPKTDMDVSDWTSFGTLFDTIVNYYAKNQNMIKYLLENNDNSNTTTLSNFEIRVFLSEYASMIIEKKLNQHTYDALVDKFKNKK
jgi:hypothetical protein